MKPITNEKFIRMMMNKETVEAIEEEKTISVLTMKISGEWYLVMPTIKDDIDRLFTDIK